MPDVPGAGVAPRVGVVLVNWRGAADTEHCLASLLAATRRPACVVVVENASGDGSIDRLREWGRAHAPSFAEVAGDHAPTVRDARAWLTLVALPDNRGFSGGNNAGLRLLRARDELTHFLLLNNDTEVAPDYFAALARALRRRPDAGLLSGTIYHFDDRRRVWYAGGRELPLRAMVVHRTERPRTDDPIATEFITGCALLVSRAAHDALGPLPECYFPAYGEDAEYCHRARRAGIAVLYAPEPVVYHRIGASTRGHDVALLPTMLAVRHRGFFVRRNLRGLAQLAALLYLAATKPARVALELARGRPAVAGAVLRGTVSGLFSPAARGGRPPRRDDPPAGARTPRS